MKLASPAEYSEVVQRLYPLLPLDANKAATSTAELRRAVDALMRLRDIGKWFDHFELHQQLSSLIFEVWSAAQPQIDRQTLLNQKLPGIFFGDSSIALVYVKDVVEGQMLAARKGRVGEKYILSSEILKVREFFETICNIANVPMPTREISPAMATMLAYMMEFRSFFTKTPPELSLALVRVMGHGMMFDNTKAKRELGMKFTPIKDALSETVAWYRTQGYAPASKPSPL